MVAGRSAPRGPWQAKDTGHEREAIPETLAEVEPQPAESPQKDVEAETASPADPVTPGLAGHGEAEVTGAHPASEAASEDANGTSARRWKAKRTAKISAAADRDPDPGAARGSSDQIAAARGSAQRWLDAAPARPRAEPDCQVQTDVTTSAHGSDEGCESNSESTEDAAAAEEQAAGRRSSSSGDAYVAPREATAPREALQEQDGASAGLALLGMLKRPGARPAHSAAHHEPQPLSTDEFALWAMQEREDREMGADLVNDETFGEDAGLNGWSFEENLAANERINGTAGANILPEPNPFDMSPFAMWVKVQKQLVGSETRAQQVALARGVDKELERLRGALHHSVSLAKVSPPCLEQVVHLVISTGWKHITWKHEYTALHLAAELGRAEILPLLISLRGDPGAKDRHGRSAVEVAKARGHREVANLLARARPLSQSDSEGRSLESWKGGEAAKTSQESLQEMGCLGLAFTESVKLLRLAPECLEAAVLYTAASGSGVLSWHGRHTSCLHLAAELCRSDLLPLLVELRADLEERDSFGFTAFEVAASKQDWVAVYVMQKLTYGEMPDPSKEQAEAFASQGGRLREGRRQDKQGGGRNASETAKSNADGEPEGEPASFQEQALLSGNSTWRYTQLQ